MNWYKKSKSLQDIAWDPAPGKENDYEQIHLDSDVSAIFEQIYPKEPSDINIDNEIDVAIHQLSEYGGENNMWKYFLKKESKEPQSDQAKYLDKIKNKIKNNYDKMYKERKMLDEGQINIAPQQSGGPPSIM
jgi:Mg2+ and Co2+ transporter CorA